MSPLDSSPGTSRSSPQGIYTMTSPSRPKPFTQAFPSSPNQSWLEYPNPVHPAHSTRKLYQNAPSDCYGPRSTMSIDGSDMYDFARCDTYSQTVDVNNPFAPPESGNSLSLISPRITMLHSILKKQALQNLAQIPQSYSPRCVVTAIPCAGDVKTCGVSPISPTGTMFSYAGGREADSGLLAVKPLAEARVAGYKFWQACGRHACPFGCGGSDEGELGVGRRLFG